MSGTVAGMVRLWLDDMRPAPEGWVHARSVNEAIRILSNGPVDEASLDHDLGDWVSEGGDGYRLVLWMAENAVWPQMKVRVHSANPVGRERMQGIINRYGPY